MEIVINGKTEHVPVVDLAALVKWKGLRPEVVVVEHNEKIVRRKDWAETRLAVADHVEILSFVGGG